MRPNVFLALGEGSAQHRRWYYELAVDHVEPFLTAEPTHLRAGWACAEGYHPWPTAGEGFGGNGVGDDLYSYGFDGLRLWSGGRNRKDTGQDGSGLDKEVTGVGTPPRTERLKLLKCETSIYFTLFNDPRSLKCCVHTLHIPLHI